MQLPFLGTIKKNMKKNLLATLFFLLISNQGYGQVSDTGNWFIYFGNQAINKKWNWHNEVQYRNYNFAGDLQQLLLRTGIGYNLSENNNNILLGYGYINSQNYAPNSEEKSGIDEHRIYQQFITRQNFSRFSIQHRYRLEQRFFADDFRLRMRYFLSTNIALNNKAMTNNTYYLSVYNEIFLNTEGAVFDRNRLYGAVGYMLNKNWRFELGFMAQTLQTSNRNQFQIVVFNNLPFRK